MKAEFFATAEVANDFAKKELAGLGTGADACCSIRRRWHGAVVTSAPERREDVNEMQRTAVNPTDWGLAFQMNQGQIVEAATRTLRCSGQVALREDASAEMGLAVVAPGDVRGQMESALTSVDALLAGAEMDRSNVVFVNFFTTDMDGFLANYDVYAGWIAETGTMPPQSLIGVSRLVLPDLLVEIEVTAAE